MKIRILPTLAVAAIAAFGATTGVLAEEVSISSFFGEYVGQSITSTDEGLSVRDLSVEIKERKDGFTIEWTTITVNVDGKNKRKSYDINFRATPRDDIYASEMRRDKFGGQVPLNPLKGDPYVWARQEGKTLTVYAIGDHRGRLVRDAAVRPHAHRRRPRPRVLARPRRRTIEAHQGNVEAGRRLGSILNQGMPRGR